VQTNHAESLNCLASDLFKKCVIPIFSGLLHEAVKNKTLFERRYCWKFSTILVASLFSAQWSKFVAFLNKCLPWRSLDFGWLIFIKGKLTKDRMKVTING